MALSQSVVSELLDAFRAGEGVDLIRDAVQLVLQELIEVEATEHIGAGRYERVDTRVTERNGSRGRLLTTQAGDVELRIPKLRNGSFFPSIIEPRRRIDQALYAVVMEAYVNGVSTRSVDDLVGALGADSGIKKSEVSRICAGLDEIVGAFRARRLDHIEFPYVYLDATYLHVRNQTGQVASMAVVIATGITATGEREVLGLDVGDSEDEVFWRMNEDVPVGSILRVPGLWTGRQGVSPSGRATDRARGRVTAYGSVRQVGAVAATAASGDGAAPRVPRGPWGGLPTPSRRRCRRGRRLGPGTRQGCSRCFAQRAVQSLDGCRRRPGCREGCRADRRRSARC